MSNFWQKILSSLKHTSEQRISNPFYGAFIFSWLVFNWKPIAIFFLSDKDIYKKIADMELATNSHTLLYDPIKMTLVMVLIIPFLNSVYAIFDVIIKVGHTSSETFDTFISSWFAIRRERHSGKMEIEKELTLAKERSVIAEEEKNTEGFKLEAALKRNQLNSLVEMEERINDYSTRLNNGALENSGLKEKVKKLEDEAAEVDKLKISLDTMTSILDDEKIQHKRTRESFNSANSQCKILHDENQNLKNELLSYSKNGVVTPKHLGVTSSNPVLGKALSEAAKKFIANETKK